MGNGDLFSVLSVAGSDPTGGAGVQGDLKTFAAHGAYGMAVVAALTAQNHLGVSATSPVSPAFVVACLEAILDQAAPAGTKTGMLLTPEVAIAVGACLSARPEGRRHLVVDPVLRATAGGTLAREGLLDALLRAVFPLAEVVTPNLYEGSVLLGRPIAAGEERDAAAALWRAIAGPAILLKGGHARGAPVDHLATARGVESFTLPRLDVQDGHGAGCALSASLAVRLGRGEGLSAAVAGAKAYVHRALAAARPLGAGRGPVRHDVSAESGTVDRTPPG